MLAKRAVEGHADSGKQDFQYLNVEEFAELVDVGRDTLLNKLSRSEFADDIVAFRKSETMRLLDTRDTSILPSAGSRVRRSSATSKTWNSPIRSRCSPRWPRSIPSSWPRPSAVTCPPPS
ncbi:MAG: hypothetical protein ACK4GB_07560, partial [Tepidimonas sp.]